MIHYYEFRWTSPAGAPFVGIVADHDESSDFDTFCENVYKEIPSSERLKALVFVFRLPIFRQFSTTLIDSLCNKPDDETLIDALKHIDLLNSLRAAILDPDSFLNRRFRHVPIWLLYSDNYDINLSNTCNGTYGPSNPIAIEDESKSLLMAHLRQTELRLFVERSPAIFGPIQHTPYQTPSGQLARIFLRVGNIQMRRTVLHAFFFWLLPHLRSTAAILTDTWSISSIAYNTTRMLARYRGEHQEIARVDMLSEYHTTDETGLLLNLEVLRRFLRGPVAVPDGTEILFLVSAVFTGELLRKIRNTIASEGLNLSSIRFVGLYRLLDTTADTFLCDLSDLQVGVPAPQSGPESPIRDLRPGETSASRVVGEAAAVAPPADGRRVQTDNPTPSGQRPLDVLLARSGRPGEGGTLPATPRIVIDPATYFPRLINEVEITVRERSIKEDKPVYDQYGALGAFLVHRTQNDDRGPRHHGVYIDTLAFIESDPFRAKLARHLAELDKPPYLMERPPNLILGPDHPRVRRLMELVVAGLRTKYGIEIPTINHPSLYIDGTQPQPEDEQVLEAFGRLDETAEILIIDDAFVTGTRLYQYSQHLRAVHGGYRGRVHFLVAVARPPAMSAWTEAQHLLRYRRPMEDGEKLAPNTVAAIETVVLPNWGRAECPWCVESGYLQDCEAIIPSMPELMRQRLELLREQNGLRDSLFLKAPHHSEIMLHPDGVFIKNPADQAAAFAAVAGGLQRLRTDLNQIPLGPHRYPLATVLKSEEYLIKVYSDALLRTSFFRAAGREELCYHDPGKEIERAGFARDDICNSANNINNVVLELCWQVLEGKLSSELFKMVEPGRFDELGVSEETKYLMDVISMK